MPFSRYFEAQIDIAEAVQGWVSSSHSFIQARSNYFPLVVLGILAVESKYGFHRRRVPTNTFVQAEVADDWSYEKGLEGGWIPQNPSNRMYPNICS